MGDTAPTQSRLCVVLCTTLWALLWTGAPVWNPSVGIKCETPLWALGPQCGVPMWSSAVGFQCAAPSEAPMRGSTVASQCGAPVWCSSVRLQCWLGAPMRSSALMDPLWGFSVGLSCGTPMCTSSRLYCGLYFVPYYCARLHCGLYCVM